MFQGLTTQYIRELEKIHHEAVEMRVGKEAKLLSVGSKVVPKTHGKGLYV